MRPRLPGRSRRSLAVLVVALLAVGAFFARGPIGLGNGPLTFASDSGSTLGLARQANVALVVPVGNPGKSPAMNGFTLIGGGKGYAAPKLVHSYSAHSHGCQGLMLASEAADGCVSGQMKLAGLTVLPSPEGRPWLPDPSRCPPWPWWRAWASPAAGTCWTLRRRPRTTGSASGTSPPPPRSRPRYAPPASAIAPVRRRWPPSAAEAAGAAPR